MKPIFTIHAGEYLVGSEIEENYKNVRVWVPSKDSGIDLLVTDKNCKKSVSLQVKFSKDFLGKGVKPELATRIKSGGWWTFEADKISNSPADYWVLVLYQFQYRNYDFIIIKPSELLARYKHHNIKKTIHSYVWVTKKQKAWETRGLSVDDQKKIAHDTYRSNIRNLTKYLNNWSCIERILK